MIKAVQITRRPDDPLCLRASIGGTEKSGYYCLFRGNQEQVLAMLELVLVAMRIAPPIAVDKDAPEIGKS